MLGASKMSNNYSAVNLLNQRETKVRDDNINTGYILKTDPMKVLYN